jgi:peptidoglycan/xylan/chitin deacetylase (PgdA/CDA1 family)
MKFFRKIIIRLFPKFGQIVLILIFIKCSEIITNYNSESLSGYCLTFDDNYVEEWYSLNELLLTRNVAATFFVSEIDSLSQNQINLLKELKASGHEIGSHGLRHTNAVEFIKNHTLEEYYNYEIKPAIHIMDSLEIKPSSFAYPYGRSSDSLDQFLLEHFKILRHVTLEQLQPPTKETDQIEEIYYRFNGERYVAGLGIDTNYHISLDELKRVLLRSKNEGTVVILFAHRPVDSLPKPYETSRAFLDSLFKIANELKLKSYKFSDLLTLSRY